MNSNSNKNSNYRKINDRSLSSSTYHKKDGTNVRAKLKALMIRAIREFKNEVQD